MQVPLYAIFIPHPNITLCCPFQISTIQSMQIWSNSFCKPIISILNLARTNLQTSDQNWSDSICKPIISILSLARTSLQTRDQRPEQVCKPVIKIGQTQSANQSFQFLIWPEQVCKPVIFILHPPSSHALFILHQSSHTLLLLSRNSLSSSEALSLISNHIPKPTLQAILFPFFISHTTLCYSNLQVFLFFRSFEFSFKPSVQIS